MDEFKKMYEFAASAGALEGYVYRKKDLDMDALPHWVKNLKTAYGLLPREALDSVQPSVDQTLGRALKSLVLTLGEEHELVMMLKSMIKGSLPRSPDDFPKGKWFQT
jgi:hypothetical protein